VQHQIEPGDVADLGLGGLAHVVDGNQQRHRNDHGRAERHNRSNSNPQALESGGRGHGSIQSDVG
jgi:hypothetical protein